MIIVKFMGGLGNQMYQYALYTRLKGGGKTVKADLSGFNRNNPHGDKRNLEITRFPNVELDVCSAEERAAFIDEDRRLADRVRRKLCGSRTRITREEALFMPEIFGMEDAYLLGYWSCPEYYTPVLPQLREAFAFPRSISGDNAAALEKIKRGHSVSIHIRRGDYLEPKYFERFGSICTEQYYSAAIKYVKDSVADPHFFVFSDDPDYVRERYCGKEFTVVDWNEGEDQAISDMQLMAACRHNICANSTFSKWAAILNGNEKKIVMAPLKHTADEELPAETILHYWKGWTFIDQELNIYR